ncbi:MAG: MBOAT family O-acyltransferase [Actinomycetes bacterium]
MLFPTMTFALFFVVVLGVAWRLHDQPRQWRWFMLAVSYLFYGWWDWRFVFLLVACTAGNHVFAVGVHRSQTDRARRTWMVVGVTFDLALLGFFKYYGFFVDSLLALLRPFGLAPTPLLIKVTLPVGISFFLFCAISYVVDVYRREQEPVAPLDFAVYLAFFPHLVAGPIVRVSEFVPQLRRRRNPDSVDAVRAVRLICRGLFKKVVIANYLATAIVDPVFVAPGQYRNWELLIGAWSYAVQIYADFSGYTDIAIGIAILLGIRFPDNFDRPYTSTSIQEFWRRWHMTLSRWLRDYLYIPLGGNRGGDAKERRNLIITMVLGGLWHGANFTFLFWGLYHGLGLSIERWVREGPDRRAAAARAAREDAARPDTSRPSPEHLARAADETVADVDLSLLAVDEHPEERAAVDAARAESEAARTAQLRHEHLPESSTAMRHDERAARRSVHPALACFGVFQFVTVGWIFFRAQDLGTACGYLWSLLTNWGVGTLVTPTVLLALCVGLFSQFLPPKLGDALEYRASQFPPLLIALGVGLWLVVINLLGPQGVAPFIYFQF